MKLYFAAASPFVRKVHIALIETGLIDHVEILPAMGHPTDPGTMPLTQNPLGKIPALERADGPALYDSRVICRYLSDLADGALYPQKPRLWETLTLEATGDGIMDAAVIMVYEKRSRSEDKHDQNWLDGQWAKVERSLQALEARWMSHLAGPLDMGQISVACALAYLDFRHAERDWRGSCPALAEWLAKFETRASFAQTKPGA